ncbi:hypothetical protein F4561_002490 [Lipingzhangella halophila]|uniref:Uncharacterized protein n=1 Tax=Lipingzhangella halophila TaxID=1783352 RepID=A0A7W7RGW2_9ACTN|nr:hypothetical protein [Lipingzhangella halophila]MBB4931670.1 hypothetical protein [Lipingzhangella halophila]
MTDFWLPPDSLVAGSITEFWTTVPLRIPAGWTVHRNIFAARRLPSGRYEAEDSEDLFWATTRLSVEAAGEEVHLDAGWYRTHFRLVVFVHGWDDIRQDHWTADLGDFVTTLESWLASNLLGGGPVN